MRILYVCILSILFLTLLSGCGDLGYFGACGIAIKDQLYDPKSAEITNGEIYYYKDSSNVSRTTLKVRATNAFGAYVTQVWECRFEDVDDGKGSVGHKIFWVGPR